MSVDEWKCYWEGNTKATVLTCNRTACLGKMSLA